MSLLRTNFRARAGDIDFDVMGKAVANWIQGSSVDRDRRYGGFVMASFASQLSGIGFLQVSAFDLMGSTFGVTLVSNVLGSGYKVVPFAFMDVSGDGISSPVFYNLSVTQGMAVANDSTIVIVVRKASQTVTNSSGIMMTLASNVTVRFIMAGWVVSAPDSGVGAGN